MVGQHLSLPLRSGPKLDVEFPSTVPLLEPADPAAILMSSWIGIASIRPSCSKRSGNGVPHRMPSRQFGPSSARCKLRARMLLSSNTSSSPASACWHTTAKRRRGRSSSRCFDVRSVISFGTKNTRGSPSSDSGIRLARCRSVTATAARFAAPRTGYAQHRYDRTHADGASRSSAGASATRRAAHGRYPRAARSSRAVERSGAAQAAHAAPA